MQKEIGSNFWLDCKNIAMGTQDTELNLKKFKIEGTDSVFLSSGRAAIQFALKDIKRNHNGDYLSALIPPYTCETVLQPFLAEGFDVKTYNIDSGLNMDEKSFSEFLSSTDFTVVLIHSYFGFNTTGRIQSVVDQYRKNGVVFIEDRTQNLFSGFQSLSVDYVVGSFRKWAAIPDGGYCIKKKGLFYDYDKPEVEDEKLIEHKLKAFQLKNDYIVKGVGDKETFLKAYAEAERILDEESGFFSMSKRSKYIFNEMDIELLRSTRRHNYSFAYENIRNNRIMFVTQELTDEVVPLYLVIRSKKRNELQSLLRKNYIYAPIVWPHPVEMPVVSESVAKLYDEVLCVPIDQRYGLDDMERMVSIINRFE